MGFIDTIKDALGPGDGDEQPTPALTLAQGRHADREAPAERMEDATQVTGGKHRA